MTNIPTAKEFIISTKLIVKFDNTQSCILKKELPSLFIEFAKLHVKAALKQASEKAEWEGYTLAAVEICEYSILNAYSLKNIK